MPQQLLPGTCIIFDTNVLVSAFVFKQSTSVVYQYCAERYELYTTEWILNELQDVLGRKKFRLPETIQNDILDQVRSDAQVITPTNTLPTDSSDPDDNNVLQAALFINADPYNWRREAPINSR